MEEMSINGVVYIATKKAAEITGYTTDYVAQLARGGKIDARLVGRNWYINQEAILKQKFGSYADSVQSAVGVDPKITLSKEESIAEYGSVKPHNKVDSTQVAQTIPQETTSKEVPSVSTPPEPKVLLNDMQKAWDEWYATKNSDYQHIEAQGAPTEAPNEEVRLNRMSTTLPVEPIEIGMEEKIEEKDTTIMVRPRTLPVLSSVIGFSQGVATAALFLAGFVLSWSYLVDGKIQSSASVIDGVTSTILGQKTIER